MKQIYVGSLKEGTRIEDVFLVASKSVATARNGAYMKLRLADKTGQVDAVKWNASDAEIARFAENDYVLVHASVGTYNDNLQLTVDSITRHGETIDPADFLPCSKRDPQQMMSELRDLLEQVAEPQLSRLLSYFFDDDKISASFMQAPAAKSIHHACIGGLLEHTLGVVRSSAALADLYPEVNRDLLITGAALHDIGKIEEYTWSGAISFSDCGHMVGHIVGGAMMAKEVADKIPGFDPLLSLAVQHMILAHHGTKEFGSPKQPKSIEAIMLHAADDLDAKAAILSRAIEESDTGGAFTKKHFLLERPLFKGMPRQEPVPAAEADLELFATDKAFDPFADD